MAYWSFSWLISLIISNTHTQNEFSKWEIAPNISVMGSKIEPIELKPDLYNKKGYF